MATPAKQIMEKAPTIALVGRVNVGKSTIFNRFIEHAHALVSSTAGTTRTRNIGFGTWKGRKIRFVDTGGMFYEKNALFETEVESQQDIALQESDAIVLLCDAQLGPTQKEKMLANKILKLGKPTMLLVNKVDNEYREASALEFDWQKLGLGEPRFVSALNGRNTGDVLDDLLKLATKGKRIAATEKSKIEKTKKTNSAIRVAIIGKPNVGKSSLFNAIVGQESVVVSSIPHTTREPFDTDVEWEGTKFTFIDTAGMRKKSLIERGIESVGIFKTLDALKSSDVVLFVMDVMETVSFQDKYLAGEIEASGKSLIIILNKCDISQIENEHDQIDAKRNLEKSIPFLTYAPVVFLSAKTAKNVHKIFPLIKRVAVERAVEVPDKTLITFLEQMTLRHKPAKGKGTRQPKILSMKQIISNPPIFEITIKYGTSLHRSYANFLENRLRESFGFTGTPIRIRMKKERR